MNHVCTTMPRQLNTRTRTIVAIFLASGMALGGFGCSGYSGQTKSLELARQGEFGRARAGVAAQMKDGTSEEPVLDRMKLLYLSLADGAIPSAERAAEPLYDNLRTQGVNEGRGFGSFVVGEAAGRIYKGDPFEQAMAFAYMGILDGLKGDWGNVRASANNSLFAVKDFSRQIGRRSAGVVEDKLAIAAASQRAEQSGASAGEDGLYLKTGERASDFELGYVLKAVATRQLGNSAEVDEIRGQISTIAPRLDEFMKYVANGNYNTVFVVDYGLGPQKIATGPDGVIAGYAPRTVSNNGPIDIRVGDASPLQFPVVTDVNRLARDVAWNNLEDVRKAKSLIGDALIVGGAATVAIGSNQDKNREATQLAGLAAILAGAALKATASADTRHCEVVPQRVYVLPVSLPDTPTTIDLQIGSSRMIVPGLKAAPQSAGLQMLYVRMPEYPPAWATSGRVIFSNDVTGEANVLGGNVPYILGGRCVRTPTDAVLDSYRRGPAAEIFNTIRLEELIDLYREEGIDVQGMGGGGVPGREGAHVLEGGNSLACPTSGSSGFLRLMCGDHAAYRPRSDKVAELSAKVRVKLSGAGEATMMREGRVTADSGIDRETNSGSGRDSWSLGSLWGDGAQDSSTNRPAKHRRPRNRE
jgi:hypothetical protein